jgi:hypothetical protein
MTAASQLAPVIADAFFAASGEPERWATLPEYKRVTFRNMAVSGLAAARHSGSLSEARLEALIGQALCDTFLAGPDCPRFLKVRYDWSTGIHREASQALFIIAARAFVAAGRELKAASRPVAA